MTMGKVLLPLTAALVFSFGSSLVFAAGPPSGLDVNVVNTPSVNVTNTPSVTVTNTSANPVQVTGTLTGTVTTTVAQNRITQSSEPTCDVLNRCFVKFPAVPANKLLRVTRIFGTMYFSNVNAFVALDRNNLDGQLFVRPLAPFNGAYLGTTLSFNEDTDVVFKGGEIPIVEIGTSGTLVVSGFNILGLTDELLDAN